MVKVDPAATGIPRLSSGRATTVPFTAVMIGPERTTTDNATAPSTCAAPPTSQVTTSPNLPLQAGDRWSRCIRLTVPDRPIRPLPHIGEPLLNGHEIEHPPSSGPCADESQRCISAVHKRVESGTTPGGMEPERRRRPRLGSGPEPPWAGPRWVRTPSGTAGRRRARTVTAGMQESPGHSPFTSTAWAGGLGRQRLRIPPPAPVFWA
jgi:hypothetical protein